MFQSTINDWCHPCWPELAGPCWKLLAAGIFCSYRHYPALGSGPANVSRHSYIMFSSAHPSVGQIRRIIQCYAKREGYSCALQNLRSWPEPINIQWDSPINQPFITDARLIGYHELYITSQSSGQSDLRPLIGNHTQVPASDWSGWSAHQFVNIFTTS